MLFGPSKTLFLDVPKGNDKQGSFLFFLSSMVSKVTVELTSFFDFFCYIISSNEEVHDRKRSDAEYQ